MANTIEITVKVRDQATAELAAIAAKAREATAGHGGTSGAATAIEVPVEADASKLEQDVERKVKRTKKPAPIDVPVEASTGDFEQQFRAAMDEGIKASGDADRAMRQSFTSMESGSRSLRAAMADLEPAAEESGRGIEDAGNKADDAGKKASSAGGGFSLAALKMTGLITAALTLAPALAALPAVGAAITVGMGTMSLGLGGVISALKDYGAQSASSGQSGAQLAQTAFSNAVAIRNAEQAIADAKKQSARAAQSSADQIYSAQERVAQATYGVQQAQQALTDAQQSATQAQQALTQAYADATNQLVDLNNAAADSSIAVEQAELRLTEARQNLAQVTGSSLSTDDQKRQAQIDLMAATQGLKDAQQKQIESQQAADAANKSGVDGMQSVVSAQNAVQKANEGVANAQHGVASATQAQTDAQTALARAVQASAQQQADSAEAIAKAEQNLSDTYEQQKLAAAAAASSGSAAADKFAQDMAKLTPAGQAFVNQLLSMRGGLDQLKATAQTTMLPGLTTMLQQSSPLLPIFNKAVGDMGTIIGNTAKSFGTLMQSPAFQGQLTKVLGEGAGLANSFASGLSGMVSGIMQAASNAGPIVSGIGNGIKLLMTSGIPDFLNGLATNATQIGQGFQGVLTIVSNLAGPLGTVASAVGAALAPGIQVLASPQVQQALQSIGTSIAQILIVLAPVVTMLAQGLAGALRIAEPLLQSLAKFMQDNATWVVPLTKGIAAATLAFIAFNAVLAVNPVILLGEAIAGLVLGLIYAWEHFKGFRDFMLIIWKVIKVQFDFFLDFAKKWWPELLIPFTGGISEIIGRWGLVKTFFTIDIPRFFGALLQFVKQWWPELLAPFTGGVSEIIAHWGSIEDFFAKAPGRLASLGAHLFDWIPAAFKWAINTVIGWWDSLSFPLPQIHIPGTDVNVGGGSIGVPFIHPFATGGVLPGGITAAIGDRGWEPLRLPDGTTVIPHANAQSMAASGALATSGGGVLQVEWVGGNAGDEFLTWLRKNIRIRHGSDPNSVQKALGQSF